MITHAQAADLCLALYAGDHRPFLRIPPGVDVYFGWTRPDENGVTNIVCRGSVTPHDWINDFDAIAPPWRHQWLGPIHPGFYRGVTNAVDIIQHETKGPRRIIGHSLGAAHASLIAGELCWDDDPPVERVVFGEPMCCWRNGVEVICKVPSTSYRAVSADGHHHDPVTDVPLVIPGIEPYCRITPLTDVVVSPADNDPWGPEFKWHHMELYRRAMEGR